MKAPLAVGVLGTPMARVQAQGNRPIRVGMTVSSVGRLALTAQCGPEMIYPGVVAAAKGLYPAPPCSAR
jgi:hypothetical protein